MESVERCIKFSDIAEKERHGARDGVSCKNIKGREGTCRDHLVIRIPTEDIHFLLFQNTDGHVVGRIKGTSGLPDLSPLGQGEFSRVFLEW